LIGPCGIEIESKEGKEEVMKRIRLLVLLGMVAVALPIGLLQGVAKATRPTGSSSTTTVSIKQYADFNLAGVQLDVGLNVSCTGGTGTATVMVTQTPPEAGHPVTGFGTNPNVVCDGQTHSVGVTVVGTVYDAGKAYAVADVTSPGGAAHAERWITIQVV
jgi:hypothetical protein